MFVSYNGYSHDEGEVALSHEREPIRDEGGVVRSMIHRYMLQGALVADSESAMDAKVAALLAAYVDGGDLALVFTAGGNTQLALSSSQCLGGTRVVRPPSFPDMRGAGYTAYLPYMITVEGEIPESTSNVGILRFSETVQRSGGGPRYMIRETLEGPPVKQQVRRQTTYNVIQSGEAIGLIDYPTPPGPLFPGALMEAPTITIVAPTFRAAQQWTEYRVSWQYVFASATPLIAQPNRQTR